jgi:hypothetical protein
MHCSSDDIASGHPHGEDCADAKVQISPRAPAATACACGPAVLTLYAWGLALIGHTTLSAGNTGNAGKSDFGWQCLHPAVVHATPEEG